MPQSVEARTPIGSRPTGTTWVRGALHRLIGETPDLRKGLRTPEEVTAEEAAPIFNRLTQTFKKHVDPRTLRTTFVVQPPTLVIDGGASGLVKSGGALTALHDRVSRTVDEALLALEAIVPLDPHADLVALRLTRAIIRSNLEALAREVQQEPRAFQMESLFESLLGTRQEGGRYKEGGGYLGDLQRIVGLGSSRTRLTGDYEQYTRFLLIRHSIEGLSYDWDSWRHDALGGELGVQFLRVTWLFQAVRETVAAFRGELDELGLGDATRWTLQVSFSAKRSEEAIAPISLGSFLDIIDVEAMRWGQLLNDGGSLAAEAIRGFVEGIHDLVSRATPDFALHEKGDSRHRTAHQAKPKDGAPPDEVDRLCAAFEVAQQRLDTLLAEIEHDLRARDADVPEEDRRTL